MSDDLAPDLERARSVALRYRLEFVNLDEFCLRPELLRKIPASLMFRYNFLPLAESRNGEIAIAVSDPSQLMLLDEISLLLGRRLVVQVAALAQIKRILHKGGEGGPEATLVAPLKPQPKPRSGTTRTEPEE
jgi:type IV pilus assembly protein PilB